MTTAADFMTAMRGIPTRHVVVVLNYMTPGVTWTGCSKRHIAEYYENAHTPRTQAVYPHLQKLDLKRLQLWAEARRLGNKEWWKEK